MNIGRQKSQKMTRWPVDGQSNAKYAWLDYYEEMR